MLTTRSGTGDHKAVERLERLRIASNLLRECLELRIDVRIDRKLYRTQLDRPTVEALSTTNPTASKVLKTVAGEAVQYFA